MSTATLVRFVTEEGDVLNEGVDAWMADATSDEVAVLDLCVGPVLDVGCGPGRHVTALGSRGIAVLGIDAAPSAVALARSRGAFVLERSVFARVPGEGRWGSALLLDGNIGIGGDPTALLCRIRELLRSGGRALIELAGPASASGTMRARVETPDRVTSWFPWARVRAVDLLPLAEASGFTVESVWKGGDRWFANLSARSSSD